MSAVPRPVERPAPDARGPKPARALDGVLVIDKPPGPTSHDVVARARRALGMKRIGHTGTLDPAATGVLPLVLGRATRLARFLAGSAKTYEAVIRLGVATDTGDTEGRAIGPPWGGLGEDEARARLAGPGVVAGALAAFAGTSEQAPPLYSAKKIAGVRAYELARKGRPVQPRPVPVTVHRLAILGLEGDLLRVEVTASAGFYMRVLADDLGRRLGVGGHLHQLRRTRSGSFGLAEAVALEALERDPETARERVIPIDGLLQELPAAVLTDGSAARTRCGHDVGPADLVAEPETPAAFVRLLGRDGRLVAVAEPAALPRFLHPTIVLG